MLDTMLFPPARLDAGRLRTRASGRRVVVTGGSRGIGAAVARRLGAAGAHLVLVARDVERLRQVAADVEESGGAATVIRADLRETAAVDAVLAHPAVQAGCDILVTNAGVSVRRPLLQSLARPDDVQRTISVNHLAPARLVLGLTPALRQTRGMIVNISAVNVLLPPPPEWAAYQASKAAFDQWLRSCAAELEALGVQVRSVYLPLVRTDMIAPNPAYQKAPAMTPERAATVVCRAMLGRRRRYQPWWLSPATALSPALRVPTEAAYRAYARRQARRRSGHP